MAQIIYGDREVFDQLVFAPPTQELQTYIYQLGQNFIGNLTDVGRQFAQAAQSTFARLDTSEAMNIARAAMRRVNVMFQADVISEVNSIDDLQSAPDSMVRWIMTHPELQQLAMRDEIDAYGTRFTQLIFSDYAWENPDYQIVNNGWVQENYKIDPDDPDEEEGDGYDIYFTDEGGYNDDGTPESDYLELLTDEEADIIRTNVYNMVDLALRSKRDPTSYYDRELS